MITEELSNGFDTLVDSYRRFKDFDKMQSLDSIEFNEYEKSLYLTLAQDDVVVDLYSGRNSFGESFETTEEMRRYLEVLVKSNSPSTTTGSGVSASSVFYTLPSDILFIIYEQVKLNDTFLGCYNGSLADVSPITHDEYNRVRRNPFRGANRNRVLRLDAGNGKVELISKYSFSNYLIRYLSKPTPIVLEDMPEGVSINGQSHKAECMLNPMLHNIILERAVQMALAAKGIHVNTNNKN